MQPQTWGAQQRFCYGAAPILLRGKHTQATGLLGARKTSGPLGPVENVRAVERDEWSLKSLCHLS